MEKRCYNPLLPIEWHIPDAEGHVMPDGKLYLYGSYDNDKKQFCSTEYYVAHTTNFIEWNIEGPIFQKNNAPWAGESQVHSSISNVKTFDELPVHIKQYLPESARTIPIEQIIQAIEENAKKSIPKETLLYAPDAIEKNNKYYLYMCLSDDTEGVAVADNPCGPFENAKQLPVNGIDPAVFVDDDGQAYYYWGQFQANVAKLNEDMMTIDMNSIKEGILTEKKHYFHEGSSVRKRGDIYYYVFADTSRGKPTCLGYATGTSPLGPFEYQGIIIDNVECDPLSWNNHGSIEEFNGRWYVFYHRSSQNSERMRRVCAEPIYFDEEGHIKEVKMTSQGPGEPFDIGEHIPAYITCGVFGGAYVDVMGDTECVIMPNEVCGACFRYIQNSKVIKSVVVEGTGDAQVEIWSDDELVGRGQLIEGKIPVDIQPGMHEIRLVFKVTCNAVFTSLVFMEY